MRSLLKISELNKQEIFEIFRIADEISSGEYGNYLKGKTAVMFFPDTSIRTRIAFERGISQLGGQTILFPPETLEKKEKIEDVVGYLNLWADLLIVRHPKRELLEDIKKYSKAPVINAMTDENHPCEILTDLYALSKIRPDFLKDHFLFCGENANIGLTWSEASKVLGFSFSQCCPKGYEIKGMEWSDDLRAAVRGKDIICTDGLPKEAAGDFKGFQITRDIMKLANPEALWNPCPPFFRGEEVSADVVESNFFVGYEFKKKLLEVQLAVIIFCLTHSET